MYLTRILILFTLIGIVSCSKTSQNSAQNLSETVTFSADSTLVDGEVLARGYCSSCHLFPEPSSLDSVSWKYGVLPKMAEFLGTQGEQNNPFASFSPSEIDALIRGRVFPDRALMTARQWKEIVKYYVNNAGPKILHNTEPKVGTKLSGFSAEILPFHRNKQSFVSMTKYDPHTGSFFIGEVGGGLFQLDQTGNVKDSLFFESTPSDYVWNSKNQAQVLTMGIMKPSDLRVGKVHRAGKSDTATIVKNLGRPVEITYSDLSGDGEDDLIVCQYGYFTGKFSWFDMKNGKPMREHVLIELPGARNVKVTDLNHDNRPDILVLMAQGNEGIFYFENKGRGKFEQKILLRFPPVYGSSYFELVDFNKDGFPDILYANGDNADYSYTIKKYHGVRLFLNNGKNDFKEAWFYPMPGAFKAMTADLDQDGDYDIAVTSFFPDFEVNPHRSFVLLENKGDLKFEASTCKEANLGRWLTMDIGDIDKDGDSDILLGSFTYSPTPVPEKLKALWAKERVNMLILRNKLKK